MNQKLSFNSSINQTWLQGLSKQLQRKLCVLFNYSTHLLGNINLRMWLWLNQSNSKPKSSEIYPNSLCSVSGKARAHWPSRSCFSMLQSLKSSLFCSCDCMWTVCSGTIHFFTLARFGRCASAHVQASRLSIYMVHNPPSITTLTAPLDNNFH